MQNPQNLQQFLKIIRKLDPKVVAQACAENFEAFTNTTMPETFSEPLSVFHRFLVKTVQTNQRTRRRVVAGGPRGWGKSTTITEGGPVWITCRNSYLPEAKQYKYILIVSDTTGQAEERLFTIKDTLEENANIERYFPEAHGKGVIWRRDKIVTRNGVCIAAKGMDSSVRGIRYKNRRPDLIIFDDPDNLDTVNSPTMSADAEERFTRDFLKCGHKYTDILVAGTVLGRNALCYKLLNRADFAAWDGRIFKALESFPDNMELWNAFGEILRDRLNPARTDDAEAFFQENKSEMLRGGVSNWPEVYPVRDLMQEYYEEGRRNFLLEKQNEIVEEQDSYFTPSQYRYYSDTELESILGYHPLLYMYIDPTGGKQVSKNARRRAGDSDRFSIAVIAKLSDTAYALVDNIYGQYPQSVQFATIANTMKKWGAGHNLFRVSAEDRGDEFYINPLREYLRNAGISYPVPRVVHNTVNKEERIAMLEPYLDNGTLLLPGNRAKFPAFYDELDDWPLSQFDDVLDSVSGCFFSAYRTFKLRYLCG